MYVVCTYTVYIYIYIYIYVYTVYIYAHMCNISLSLPLALSLSLSFSLSLSPSLSLSLYLSIYLSLSISLSLSIYIYICIYVWKPVIGRRRHLRGGGLRGGLLLLLHRSLLPFLFSFIVYLFAYVARLTNTNIFWWFAPSCRFAHVRGLLCFPPG